MHYKRLRNSHWKMTEEKFEKKLSSWKGKLMFVGGRLVLINSILTSLTIFMLSFFEVLGVYSREWIIFGLNSSGKVKIIRRNIGLLDGTSFANLRIKEVRY
jgi:hypothetical protein